MWLPEKMGNLEGSCSQVLHHSLKSINKGMLKIRGAQLPKDALRFSAHPVPVAIE